MEKMTASLPRSGKILNRHIISKLIDTEVFIWDWNELKKPYIICTTNYMQHLFDNSSQLYGMFILQRLLIHLKWDLRAPSCRTLSNCFDSSDMRQIIKVTTFNCQQRTANPCLQWRLTVITSAGTNKLSALASTFYPRQNIFTHCFLLVTLMWCFKTQNMTHVLEWGENI